MLNSIIARVCTGLITLALIYGFSWSMSVPWWQGAVAYLVIWVWSSDSRTMLKHINKAENEVLK